LLNLVKIKNKNIIQWVPLSVILTIMIYTSSKTLEYLSISIFTLLKNFSIILTALIEWYLYGKLIELQSWVAFLLMFISSYIGENNEFYINSFGYFFMSCNIISTSVYVLYLKHTLDKGVSLADPVLFCNLLSVPQLLVLSYFFEDLSFSVLDNVQIFLICISGISVFFTSYTTCYCLSLLSSTTLSMLGAINKLLMSFTGIIFIGEKNVGALKICSLFLGSLSGFLYSNRIKKEQ
ncbi:hypothetical protein H311_04440, partial [Anncaliia algerae PRA109]